MGVLYSQASFKNSRVSTRQATTSANVEKITISNVANSLVAAANSLRTYITVRSEATTAGDDIRYDYFDNPNILTQGFLLKAGEAIDLEDQSAIYARAVANSVTASVDEGSG
jgi:hypothetical protein